LSGSGTQDVGGTLAEASKLADEMRILAESLGYAVSVGFLLLAFRALADLWMRRERRDAYLACAIGGLAILALASQLELAYPPIAHLGGVVALVSLMASAYALLLFRGTFIPLSRGAKVAAAVAVVGTTLANAKRSAMSLGDCHAVGDAVIGTPRCASRNFSAA